MKTTATTCDIQYGIKRDGAEWVFYVAGAGRCCNITRRPTREDALRALIAYVTPDPQFEVVVRLPANYCVEGRR